MEYSHADNNSKLSVENGSEEKILLCGQVGVSVEINPEQLDILKKEDIDAGVLLDELLHSEHAYADGNILFQMDTPDNSPHLTKDLHFNFGFSPLQRETDDDFTLHGSLEEVKAQIQQLWAQPGGVSLNLSELKTPDLSVADSVKLFAELRAEMGGSKLIFFENGNDWRMYDLSRTEDLIMQEGEMRALIKNYIELEPDPLSRVIENYVDFYSLGLSPDGVTGEELKTLTDMVKESPDILINIEKLQSCLRDFYEAMKAVPEHDLAAAKDDPLFVLEDDILISEDHRVLNGYLWATEGLMARVVKDRDIMEQCNFYVDLEVETSKITVTAAYDTIDGHHKYANISLSENENMDLLAAMEDYCKERYHQSCEAYLNTEREEWGLAPVKQPVKRPALDEILRGIDSKQRSSDQPLARSERTEPCL